MRPFTLILLILLSTVGHAQQTTTEQTAPTRKINKKEALTLTTLNQNQVFELKVNPSATNTFLPIRNISSIRSSGTEQEPINITVIGKRRNGEAIYPSIIYSGNHDYVYNKREGKLTLKEFEHNDLCFFFDSPIDHIEVEVQTNSGTQVKFADPFSLSHPKIESKKEIDPCEDIEIIVILDVSESMNDGHLETAKEGIKELVSHYSNQDNLYLTFTTFDEMNELIIQQFPMKEAIQDIDGMLSMAQTNNKHTSWLAGLNSIPNDKDMTKRVLFVSDNPLNYYESQEQGYKEFMQSINEVFKQTQDVSFQFIDETANNKFEWLGHFIGKERVMSHQGEAKLVEGLEKALLCEQNNLVQFELFPNPAVDLVYLKNATIIERPDELSVQVYNSANQRIDIHVNTQSDRLQMNFSKLPSGTYTIHIYRGSTFVQHNQLVIR